MKRNLTDKQYQIWMSYFYRIQVILKVKERQQRFLSSTYQQGAIVLIRYGSKRMQQMHHTRTLKMRRNMPRWTLNRARRTLMATLQLCLVRRNPKSAPSFLQVCRHCESVVSFLASVPYSVEVHRLRCRCATIPESAPFKAILWCKSLTPGESAACSKPKWQKVSQSKD